MNGPNFVASRAIPRRTFLRGAGVSLALPLLEAMAPTFSRAAQAAAAKPTPRLVAMSAGLGFHGPHFFPRGTGKDWTPGPYLDVIKAYRQNFTVFSGLSHPNQNGANGHASGLTWLTSMPRPGLPGFRNAISLDQFVAARVGTQTRFPYVTLSNGGESLSWTANGVPIPAESSPAKVFRQLFIEGTATETAGQVAALRTGRSILDTVNEEARKLQRTLGRRDQDKLDQYLTSVRDLETRLVQNEAWATKPKPKADAPPPTDIQNRNDAIGRQKLMQQLIVLALQTDSTRTITFNLGGLNSVPLIPGVSNDWHNLSHHGQDEAKIEELKIIELAEFAAFAEFLGRLQAVREGGATLLDRTAVLFGSNLGNASAHDWHNLPILVAGGGFRHGQHLSYDAKNNTPFANLFVSLAHHMGVETDQFGTSTKPGVPGFELAPA